MESSNNSSQKNHWYVITGGPCCGKTTTVHLLAARGYKTTIEEARHYLLTQRQQGHTVDEVRSNYRTFQLAVLKMQVEQEAALLPGETVFLDRAIPDARAYYRFYQLTEDKEVTDAIARVHYRKFFILQRLPLVHDYARRENEYAQVELERRIREVYSELGFPIVDVPVMFPEERADLILGNL